MSHLNKPNVEQSFKIARQYLKSAVPPCQITIDDPAKFEVVAVNNGQEHLFGSIVMHEHLITIGFNTEIPDNELQQLVPDRLIKMMNRHRRIEIINLETQDRELSQDLRDTCDKMLYYFNEKGWSPA